MMKRVLCWLLMVCFLPVMGLADGMTDNAEAEETFRRWPFFQWKDYLGNGKDKGWNDGVGNDREEGRDDRHEDEWNNGLDKDWWNGRQWENTYRRTHRARLLMRLATRSGPSTNYDELGSYFQAGQEVTVISRAWDNRNDIWWVQVEFTYKNTLQRAYTGLKRVNIDVNRLTEERALCNAWVSTETIPYQGPGYHYKAHRKPVEYATTGTVYAYENGWMQFEFYEAEAKQYRRVWLPADCLQMNAYAGRR